MTATRQQRIETLYRVMYESFTPEMMHRSPMWLKRRIAATLGWRLVRSLDADSWLETLFVNSPDDPSPISISMFESCAGGSGMRVFLNVRWLWRRVKRIWKGDTRKMPPNKPVAPLRAPGMLPDEAHCMDTRRRLL
jgi:hypothetical protein